MVGDTLGANILLIRHAKSSPSPAIPEAQWPLSPLGQEQAARLADQLSGHGITTVVSSPYRRAVDTVNPLAGRLGLSVQLEENLRERKLSENARDDREALIARAWADFSFALPNCESGLVAQKRICHALDDIARKYAGQTIAACSHGNAIGLFLNTLDPNFGYGKWQAMKNPDIFHIIWDGTRWRQNGLS